MRGGNWIVGFHADFDQVSGKNKQMFMLVAIGTIVKARQNAASASGYRSDDPVSVSGLEVSAVIREQRLLRQLDTGQEINADGWDFLAERRKIGAIAAAVELGSDSQPGEPAENVSKRQASARYLRALPCEIVSTELYRLLETDTSLTAQTLLAIKELRLGRPDLVRHMFDSPIPHVRWAALQSLNAASNTYSRDDIRLLQELQSLVPTVLLARPLVARKKMFGGEKQEWECICGNWTSANESCNQCQRNQYGIGPTDLTPKRAVSFLNARIEALRLIYTESDA